MGAGARGEEPSDEKQRVAGEEEAREDPRLGEHDRGEQGQTALGEEVLGVHGAAVRSDRRVTMGAAMRRTSGSPSSTDEAHTVPSSTPPTMSPT